MEATSINDQFEEETSWQIKGEIYDDRQVFRNGETGRFMSRYDVMQIWNSLIVDTGLIEDQHQDQTECHTWTFEEPLQKDRIIRSYINEKNIPLAGFELLNQEHSYKVATGVDVDWNNLMQTMRDAVKYDATKRGVSVQNRLKSFEAYAGRKYAELNKNRSCRSQNLAMSALITMSEMRREEELAHDQYEKEKLEANKKALSFIRGRAAIKKFNSLK